MKVDYENGRVNELDQMTIDFNSFLKTWGIDALFTEYSGTNYFTIWVHSTEDVIHSKQILKTSSRGIIGSFRSILAKNNYAAELDRYVFRDFSISFVYAFEIACVNHLIRRCKQQIIDTINHQLITKPEYIFCHGEEDQSYSSMPGYRFIYSTPQDLQQSSNGDQEKIKAICDTVLKGNDKSGFYAVDKFQVSFFDKVTSASSLYGMSRED